MLIRGMVKTSDTLFICGAPDVAEENDPYAAYEGRKGALLWAINPKDGQRLAEWKLDSPPVFDGMSAASQRLYVAGRDGTVTCLGRE